MLLETGDSYLRSKFPRLPVTGRGLSARLFGAEVNLRQLSRFLGMDGLVSGDNERDSKGDSNVLGNGKRNSNVLGNSNSKGSDAGSLQTNNAQRHPLESQPLATLLALIGLMNEKLGRDATDSWLTDRYFSSSLFSPTSLLPTQVLTYPIPHLATHLRLRSSNPHASPEFRLHQESGRCSNDSMFVVGVYAPEAKGLMGEGSGASIALAQRRAAVEALKRIYLQ